MSAASGCEEMQEPILHGHDELRNPCDRVGPFSLDYYRRAAAIAVATLHGVSGK
jgi:hypothetical protein